MEKEKKRRRKRRAKRKGWGLLLVSKHNSHFLFQIEDAQVQDTGRYTCEATNVAGKTEKNYNVNIWGKYKGHLSNKAASLRFAFTDCVSFQRGVHPSCCADGHSSFRRSSSRHWCKCIADGRMLCAQTCRHCDFSVAWLPLLPSIPVALTARLVLTRLPPDTSGALSSESTFKRPCYTCKLCSCPVMHQRLLC